MIPSGTTITFSVAGRTGGALPITAGDLRSAVIDQLTPFFQVLSVDVVRPSLVGGIFDPSQWYYWDYTATVVATVQSSYGTINDVESVVVHAFVVAAGDEPTVTAPGYGQVDPGGINDDPNDNPVGGLLPTLSLVTVAAVVIVVALAAVVLKSEL